MVIENWRKIISAFANTNGGIILVGVSADTKTNKPVGIPGIELKEGLEETIINICYSNISPALMPEVKVCPFKSNPNIGENDKAVIFIRVNQSYNAPHYLLHSNEIPIRLYNENELADLRTIEDLISRREEVKTSSASSSSILHHLGKLVTSEEDMYFTIVITPNFAIEPVIHFNRENIDWLLNAMNDLMKSIDDQKYRLWGFDFMHLNTTRQITRFCRIREGGQILFQKGIGSAKVLEPYEPIEFLIIALKMADQIHPHFGFLGDLSIGLTIASTRDISMLAPGQRYLKYECEYDDIFISKTVRYDELSKLGVTAEFFFEEIIRWFGIFLNHKVVKEELRKFSQLLG